MGTPVLSPEGTLLLPVAPATVGLILPPHRLLIGDTVFYPKTELHLTIFGYATGRLIRAACAVEPELEARINALLRDNLYAYDAPSAVREAGAWYLLTRLTLKHQGSETLCTLIRLVQAKLGWIYREVAAATKDEQLKARLAVVPPAHVTCYTTDPAGKAGIGVNCDDDLKPDGPLRARRLPEGG